MMKETMKKITVVGLGYVGFPLALELSKHFTVIGYDVDKEKVEKYSKGLNVVDFNKPIDFSNRDISFTYNIDDCKDSNVYIIAVPTPVDDNMIPRMDYVFSASEFVGSILNKGDLVIYEATVYPTATENECIPILEKESNLVAKKDFKYGYSPERVSPGTKEHEFTKIVKVISGCDDETLNDMENIYEKVIEAGTYRAASIKIAEAVKITENVQRDVNIALINELSQLYDVLDINIYDVINAASTKWNFGRYFPGMVGGHCISVDPYYLLHKSKNHKVSLNIVEASRNVNEQYFKKFTYRIISELLKLENKEKRVLLMGAAYKENVEDFRNTKVVDMYNELNKYGIDVKVTDAHVDKVAFYEEYNVELCDLNETDKYDLVFIYQPHDIYTKLKAIDFEKILVSKEESTIYDYKNVLGKEIREGFRVI